ncbi:aminotransferase class V-fold PLP-dependent enzyme [Hyphomicrobium sp.]|uniref:pyridoxal phosphate-dependent decarboxylase family protein n=1 Tax=Hyphomicrobium sp. TaxID=82 RepID=UPI000FBBC1A7|nr:aminotransferase class V-fold PLP-dependent enzyme [Hyphomicrobium sp.]RUP10432.1 MAG: aminotransferase class V-fold PLP-dependent enzyme [Hyphomicrobium sp.]
MTSREPRDLDPADWSEFRRLAHAALDEVITHVQSIREKPVWQRAPDETRQRFAQPLPHGPRDLSDVLADVRTHVAPFATGNLHPRFMGWAHGAGTPAGMVAEMIAAGLNMNCGGRDHIGIDVERQIVRWMSEAFGYPQGASGLFLTGSSMANFLAVIVAKTNAIGAETREAGLRRTERQLAAYTSAEAHSCIAQAMQLAGIGSEHLRRIDTDSLGRMRPDTLKAAIRADRDAGFLPFLVVATAGTVNTGAIDPLSDIARIASADGLWFHVDGAIGALSVFSEPLKHLTAGIELSHSIALDFHKWGHVPYDAGFLLVRDGAAHKRAFASTAAYLQRSDRGLAAGETWPCDLGPDLSRGFRALKTWMTFETLGSERIGDAILHTCELAGYLAERVRESALFELKAPVALNIVCFGVKGASGAVNRDLVLDLHELGIAAPSWTTINGEDAIRCAIFNHRTTRSDIDLFMDAIGDMAKRA